MNEIYLDNAATTRPREGVFAAMRYAEDRFFYNSAAMYTGALQSKLEIAKAVDIIHKRLVRSGNGEVVMTSGATEGNNMVIFGKLSRPKQHAIFLAGEHSSVYAPSVAAKSSGAEVDYLPLERDGLANLDTLRRLLRPTTALVVFGLVNSDTGAIQPATDIVRIVRSVAPNAHVHCDAVQGFCKLYFDAEQLGLDSCAVSAHKVYGPKGVGALWLRKGVTLKPIMYGGSQQDYRPGTENNAGIIGFARAVELFDVTTEFAHVSQLRQRLVGGLPRGCHITNETINPAFQSPYIANIMLPGVFGNTVMNALSARKIYVGLGSACAAKASKNRTLMAMGIKEEKTKHVLRISLGHYNTVADVDVFLAELAKVLSELA